MLLRPLLRWTANSGTPEIFTAASLLLVVAIAALMQMVGLMAVALSMLISPLLLVAVDKLLLPRYARDASGSKARLPEISEPQHAQVIIAGFGRYGQIIGRMLLAQGIAPTVLDHDADLVDSLRSFGYRVFYGDATRLDLLRTAGAANAQILVVAVDDVEQSLTIVDLAKEHFGQLQIVARAGCAALERAA